MDNLCGVDGGRGVTVQQQYPQCYNTDSLRERTCERTCQRTCERTCERTVQPACCSVVNGSLLTGVEPQCVVVFSCCQVWNNNHNISDQMHLHLLTHTHTTHPYMHAGRWGQEPSMAVLVVTIIKDNNEPCLTVIVLVHLLLLGSGRNRGVVQT